MTDDTTRQPHRGPTVLGESITLSPGELAELSRISGEHFLKLFQIDELRCYLMLKRWHDFQAAGGKVAVQEERSSDVIENTIEHNIRQLGTGAAFSRPMGLLGPLLGIDQVMFHRHETRVLIVGPRTENEILLYLSHGFAPGKVRGLDLMSYSPWVDVGDMHAMPYADNSFDVVLFSWVLGYSSNQGKAVVEAVRVVRPGGLVGIGEEFEPKSAEEHNEKLLQEKGYTLHGTVTTTAERLIGLFGEAVAEVVFRTEPPSDDRARVGWISTIVRTRK